MRFVETELNDVFVIELDAFQDDRGYFARAFCTDEFQAAGLIDHFVQMNMSNCAKKGTLRGLHYQDETAPEAKLIRCINGRVCDVVVDMRPESSTYGRWVSVELSAENRRAVYVPPICAHGYLSLTDGAEVLYQTSTPYTPSSEKGVRHDDPQFSIEWPIAIDFISPKDASWPNINIQDVK